MGWWEGVRRRRSAPADTPAAAPSAPSGAEQARASSVPGDWDGGWRRVPPPPLTVARAPLGVSDGLTFRSGLASWQDPSFDTGLGHGLLPSAPVGLVHGVTRPAVQRSESGGGGGPLLLRSLPEPGTEEAGDGEGAGPASGSGGPPVQRSARAGGRGSGEVRRANTPSVQATSAGAGRAVADGAGQVTGLALPVVRRLAVVPTASRSTTAPRRSVVEPAGAGGVRPRPLGPSLTVARRVATGPVRRVAALRPEPVAGVVQRAVVPDRPTGRAPLGAPMSELPPTAAPLAADGPSRSAAADVQPTSGAELPVVQRRADAPESAPGEPLAADARPATGPPPPVVQRRADTSGSVPAAPRATSRPLLPDAQRGTDGSGSAVADGTETARAAASRPSADPVLPVVQRQADAPAPTGRELPADNRPETSRTATADTRPAPAPAPGSAPPVVQRRADASGATPPAAQPTTRPLLPGVRSQADAPAPNGPEAPRAAAADAHSATGPVPPVVQRRTAAPDSTPADVQAVSKPLPPVVRRAVDAPDPTGRELPVTAPRPAAAEPAPGPVLPVVRHQPDGGSGPLPADRTVTGPGPATGAVPAAGPGPAAAEGSAPARRTGRTGTSGARARGGLGAPLPALPPTAAPRGPAVDAGGRPAPPTVQRLVARQGTDTGPVPASAAPLLGSAGPGAPGSVDVPPSVEGPAPVPATPLAPLVTRTVAQPGPTAPDAPGAVPRAVPAGTASGGRGPRTQGPVVVARAVAGPRRAVGTTARSLLSARPLTLSTRVPEGLPRPPRSDAPGAPAKRPPVVAASWRRDPAPAVSAAPSATPMPPRAHRTPAPAPAPAARPKLPVVRPDAPVQRAAAGTAPHAALPLTEALAPSLQASPAPLSPASGGLPVPVVRAVRAPEPAPVLTGAIPVDVVQRDAKAATAHAPARGRPRSASAPPSFPAPTTTAGHQAAPPPDPGIDLEDLARRLLDPLARLLRADLRRGRERAGRPYDGRR
ncbi:hypothetical protein [Streptomyces sp. NPDC048106]|uniref:hypothetical protein n=1 Tax=Streptomyces sp. NPDC048106 TaxID=3155750 RepID=UPI0034554DB2